MKAEVVFEESGKRYTLDLLKLLKGLNITEEQVKHEINDILSKNG